jgi:integrase
MAKKARVRAQHGGIRKRKTGGTKKWLGSYWEDGHHKSPTLGLCSQMTKAEAEAALDKLVRPVNEARGAVEYSLSGFTETVAWPWFERQWKPSTAQTTKERQRRLILDVIGDTPLSDCNRSFLQDFLDKTASDGYSHSTVLHVRWDLRQLFSIAVNDGLLQRNPAELLHAPRTTAKPPDDKKRGKREKRVLTIQQATIILSSLGLRERLIVRLAGVCGMRPGEIAGLCWRHINEQALRVEQRLYRGKLDTPKSEKGLRAVPLPQSVRDDINEWRNISRNTKSDDWVFANERGKPLWINTLWYDHIKAPVLDKLGLGWVNYLVLRRSAITLLNAQANADATIIAALCGHRVDVSTNVYNKVGLERQLAALQTLDNALSSATANMPTA